MFAALIAFAVVAQAPVVHQIKVDYPGGPAPAVFVQLYPGEWRERGLLPGVSVKHATAGGRTTTTLFWPASDWHDVVIKRTPPSRFVRIMVNGVASPPMTVGDSHSY